MAEVQLGRRGFQDAVEPVEKWFRNDLLLVRVTRMLKLVLVGLGGALGSISRYAVSSAVQRLAGSPAFPWGTGVVNLAGSFLVGLVAGLAVERISLSMEWRLLLVVGFLGGFTTFSALSIETLTLIRSHAAVPAVANAMAQLVAGVGLAWAGFWLGTR